MHRFVELVDCSTAFILRGPKDLCNETEEALQSSANTNLVMDLQMIRMQKIVMAVGTFSILEAILQEWLGSPAGFVAAESVLQEAKETDFAMTFRDYRDAINVLKHGRRCSTRCGRYPQTIQVRVREKGHHVRIGRPRLRCGSF